MRPPKTLGEAPLEINIVAPPESDGWVLRRWAERWAEYLPAQLSTSPKDDVDVNFYVNYYLYNGATKALDACYFTHREASGGIAEKFDQVAKECDLPISQSVYTRWAVKESSGRDSEVIWPGLDPEFHKTKILGAIGKNHASGRKRYDWIDAIDIPGIEIRRYEGIAYKDMPKVYEEIDYLLVTSDREGGPMPVAEAIGAGVPIIMPEGVGWYSEVPCLRYDGLKELGDLLKGLAGWITHEESAEQLRRLFKENMV